MKTMKIKYIKAHMEVAHVYADLSSCERLKVGAIVVKDDRIISIGYNGTPAGDNNCCEDENNVTKAEVLHAEFNAIAKLARSVESSESSFLFCTHAPCKECAKLIYAAGIKKVYFRQYYRDEKGVDFLNAHAVKTEYFDPEKHTNVQHYL